MLPPKKSLVGTQHHVSRSDSMSFPFPSTGTRKVNAKRENYRQQLGVQHQFCSPVSVFWPAWSASSSKLNSERAEKRFWGEGGPDKFQEMTMS
jgi:hypothetical protein